MLIDSPLLHFYTATLEHPQDFICDAYIFLTATLKHLQDFIYYAYRFSTATFLHCSPWISTRFFLLCLYIPHCNPQTSPRFYLLCLYILHCNPYDGCAKFSSYYSIGYQSNYPKISEHLEGDQSWCIQDIKLSYGFWHLLELYDS